MKFRQPRSGYAVLRERMEESGALPSIGRVAPPPPAETAGPPAEPAETTAVQPNATPTSSEGPPDKEPFTPREASATKPPQTLEALKVPAGKPGVVQTPAAPEADRIAIKLSAPAAGAFPYYDEAAATVGHRMAMLSIVAKAFDMLEADLAAGERITAARYKGDGKLHRASTTRTVPRSLLTQARGCIDPMGILTPAAFVRILSATAFTRYLKQQSSAE